MKLSSLYLKILSGIIFFCFLIFALIFYLIVLYQKEAFFDFAKSQAYSSSIHLQTVFSQSKDVADKTKVQELVYSLSSSYPSLTKIDVNLMQEGKLITSASLDFEKVGKEANIENYEVFHKGKAETEEFFSSVFSKDKSFFKVILPVKLSGAIYGTYEIVAFPDKFSSSFEIVQGKIMQTMLLGVALLALVLFLFLDSLVLRPIKKLEKGVDFFSKGKFDYKIEEKGLDEFSGLAKKLNEMSKELYKSYDSLEEAIDQRTKELEEARAVLEIKVSARTRQLQEMNNMLEDQVREQTKELQKKIKELEKFNKLMIDRELRMVELKKELKKFKDSENNKR
jgi:methyl-accepting chemotaxis protein